MGARLGVRPGLGEGEQLSTWLQQLNWVMTAGSPDGDAQETSREVRSDGRGYIRNRHADLHIVSEEVTNRSVEGESNSHEGVKCDEE